MTREASGPAPQLLRNIGFFGIAIVALNGVIGAGIFALPAAITARAGALSPWLFLIIGALVITIVLTFAELASYFRNTGGPILYTTQAFGKLTGFSTGWILFLSRVTAYAANMTVMAKYLGAVVPFFATDVGRALFIIGVGGGLTWANYVGVRDGVRTLGVLTFLKLVPIVLLILLGLPYVTGDTLLPASLPTIDDLGGTTLLLIYAYVGFESTTIISGEAKNPTRGLPVALVSTVILIAVLYFLIVLVYISVLPDASSSQTLIDVGRVLAGPAGALAITVAAVFSIGGNLASIMLAVPRLTFALSEQRMLPGWFGAVHQRFATPGNSILFLGVLGVAFALTGTFAKLAVASSLMRLICYVLCIAALPAVRRKADEAAQAAAFKLKGGYLIPAIAMALCVWIMLQSASDAWLMTGILLLIGLGLYWLTGRESLTSKRA
ncbi:MAG: APC family permease [Gammaproteobacteria bacterium]|nr:APC family permease [Gammaproteobacteria bacterium]